MVRKITVSLAFLVLTLRCQTYDFEPVTPLALAQTTQSKNVISRRLKPNLMILVDKSGSMLFPVDSSSPNCPANCGSSPANLCPSNCPTRIGDLRAAMGQFLTSSGNIARMGVAFFPLDNSSCSPTAAVSEDLPAPTSADDSAASAANTAKASAINAKIQAAVPAGGTPTAASLQLFTTYPGLTFTLDSIGADDFRQDFILLLTDGLPNCNPDNPNKTCNGPNLGCDIDAGTCTTSSCAGALCSLGCLDRSGSIDAVQALRTKKIETIVVGFGADTASGVAPDTLNAMAEAGGFARTCPQNSTNTLTQAQLNAECGTGGTCLSTYVCQKKFYQARNASELATALANISDILGTIDPCEFPLDAQPSQPEFLTVIVDGVVVPGCDPNASSCDTWQYTGGKIFFRGAKCDLIKQSTSAHPVKVEIRIVEKL